MSFKKTQGHFKGVVKLPAISFIAVSLCIGMLTVASNPTQVAGQPRPASRWVPRNNTNSPSTSTCTSDSASGWAAQERIVFLTGEIDATLAQTVIAELLYLDAQAPGKDIFMYINSGGGDVAAGLAIYDVMRSLRSNIVTVSMGEASSMAGVLLATGTKGKRFVLPNTRIMIHQPWNSLPESLSTTELQIAAKESLYSRTKLNQMLTELTGQPLKRIETDTERDYFMSAQEAKAYGLIDAVVNRVPSIQNPNGK